MSRLAQKMGALAIGLSLLLPARFAEAEPKASSGSAPTDAPGTPYELSRTSGWFLTGELLASLTVFATSRATAGSPATTCGWCETNGFDTSIRSALMMNDSRTPATLSHVLSIGVAPAVALSGTLVPAMVHGVGPYGVRDAVVILNSLILTVAVTDGTKKIADRQRPAFHYGRQAQTEAGDTPREQFLSFFSGDTSTAFSLVSSGTTLAFLHGYETAPYLALGGGAVAVGTGLLRISADMHWATDVMVGAAVGTSIGFSVPFFLHPRKGRLGTIAWLPVLEPDRVGLTAVGAW